MAGPTITSKDCNNRINNEDRYSILNQSSTHPTVALKDKAVVVAPVLTEVLKSNVYVILRTSNSSICVFQ